MLENLYTTKMSSSKKALQRRFTKIRSASGRLAKMMSFFMAFVLLAALGTATIVMAATGNEEKNFIINGKEYAITPILIENTMATHTDSYYVPLRDTFEALGYKVYYDVDKSKYTDYMGQYSFPLFNNSEWEEFVDETGESYRLSMKSYYDWLRSLVANNADYYIYGATGRMNAELPVIEMVKGGETEFCQIGSWDMSFGSAAPPVLINGKAYIPLRAVANLVGGIDNVKWNHEKHDTYFDGTLTFDEETLTVNIKDV